MLASLSIRNFVLIEDAVLEFEDGLTVLTGETGAGKTLLTRALGLLMGERAEEGLVGPGGDEASIEAVFLVGPGALDEAPEQVRDLVRGEGGGEAELVVTRRLSREGRNRCYINGASVTLAVLGEALSRLLSFAGQHEYRRLLDPAYQLNVLDEWAGPDTLAVGQEYRAAFAEAQETVRALEAAERSQEARSREVRLLRYEVDELTRADLCLAEEEALLAEQRMLASAEELLITVGNAADLVSNDRDDPDASGLVAQAAALLSRSSGVDDVLDELGEGLIDVQYRLSELARDLHSHLERIIVDPERLQAVEARLRLYHDLGRKYGGTTRSAVEHWERSQERLAMLEQTEDDLRGMGEARAARCALALELAGELSRRRREAIPKLEEAVRGQLDGLGMPDADFRVVLHDRAGWAGLRDSGAESAEFLLAANPGQRARGLAATASGGELSRVLLALKCALAGAGGDETLVFDEVDAGIGGRTAVAVADKLRQLSCRSQLVIVTHLATVAAGADRHYLIEKSTNTPAGPTEAGNGDSATTSTRLLLLEGEAVVEELCRMMGGRPEDGQAMAHARDLRDRAKGSC